MKWFDKKDFDRVKQHIDVGHEQEIGGWYWANFKNNATTLALAYVYAVMNNKSAKSIKKLYSLLTPPKKSAPLEYNDVVSEIWHHDNIKAIKSIGILVDNNVPFQIKDGDVLREFFTNPKLVKVKEAIEKNPNIISKYIKDHEIQKVESELLASKDYEIVKAALANLSYKSQNSAKYSGRRFGTSVSSKTLLLKTAEIKDNDIRKRYIIEEVFKTGSERIENLFSTLLELYHRTKFTVDDIFDILKKLSRINDKNGTPTGLFFYLHRKGRGDLIRAILKHWDASIWHYAVNQISNYDRVDGVVSDISPYRVEWITDYIDTLSDDNILDLIPYTQEGDDTFVSAAVNERPHLVEKITDKYPDKLPQALTDIFLF